MPSLLTIVIPTYNRNEKLLKNINHLLPQLTDGVSILILDNCSVVPVTITLAGILKAYPNIKVITNEINIGGHGNFIKGILAVQSPWLWLLGDDDFASPDAISLITSTINQNPDIGYINFSEGNTAARSEEIIYSNKESLIDGLDDFGNFLFISVGVFQVALIQKGIRQMYEFAYSHAPQVALVLYAFDLNPKFTVMLSHKVIIAKNNINVTEWSWLDVSISISIIYEMASNISNNAKRKWMGHILSHVRTPAGVYKLLSAKNFHNNDFSHSLYVYDQIFLRSIKGAGAIRILSFPVFRILILLNRLRYLFNKIHNK